MVAKPPVLGQECPKLGHPHAGSQNKPGLVPAGTSCSSPAVSPNTISSAKNSCMEDELRSAPSARQGLGREGRGPCVKDTLLM